MDLGFRREKTLYGNTLSQVQVSLATRLDSGEVVVLKELRASSLSQAHKFMEESWLNSTLSHKGICPVLGSFFMKEADQYRCAIVLERQATDLEKLIKAVRQDFREDILWSWLEEVAEALAYAQAEVSVT